MLTLRTQVPTRLWTRLLWSGLILAVVAAPSLAQEPLRTRRNIFGMHNLKDGGPPFETGMEWTQHMAGNGFVFDWVTDIQPWVAKAFELNLIPCIRVQECNGGCTPSAAYAGNVAWSVLNYKLANPQYADRLVYLQLWNEPSDPRDSVAPDVYANYLVAAHNAVHQAENQAALQNPDVAGTLKTMTPGQNGPSWWNTAFTANPDAKFAFDVWGTHPYPEATPPHYNLHDGDVYIETSKTVDSYLMDLDVVASPHGSPARSRRGFPVMITETAYGDHLGISYEGWPKTSRQMAADYNVDAFGERWYKWPEIIAAHPFILANLSWEAFAFVTWTSGSTDSNGDGIDEPTAPYPQYTDVRNLRLQKESQGMASARLTAYRGAVGSIAGTITRSDTSAAVSRATIYTDGYEFGNVSLYDGGYEVHDVPVGTYTLSVSKNGFVDASQQITVVANQTTTANFSLVYRGKVSKGLYFVDSFAGHTGCSGCQLSATYHAQSFTTSSDVTFIKYAACKPNVDNVTMKFSIRQGSPTGTQIGSDMTATLESGVGANMIGGEWPDGQEPVVQPNTTYYLRFERSDGQSVYCYASDSNPYAGGNAYPGGSSQGGWDFYAVIRGLTEEVVTATGTIAGTVLDTNSAPISGATVSTSPGGYSATTNANGQYTISSVPIGSYSVSASKTGYSTETATGISVQDGQTTTVNFVLDIGPTTGTIAGTIRDGSNNPLAGATVETTSGGYSTTTAVDGTYTLNNVTPATYTVEASKTGYVTEQQSGVQVVAGQTSTVNLNLNLVAPFGGVVNGNMEGGGFDDPNADHRTANSWHQFTLSGFSKSNVTWLGGGAHSANYVQDFWEAGYVSGIYQQIANATIDNTYEATVWVKGSSTSVKFWIGIDPTGGASASSQDIVWSNEATPGTTWTQISVQTVAQANTVTLFLMAENPTASNLNAFFDDAVMTEQSGSQPPTITRSPATLTPSVVQGNNATSQSFTVQNTGGGTLSYSITDDVAWLSVTPSSGVSAGEVDTIAVDYTTSGLSVGTYNATITISDPNATNNPQTIGVTLTVTSQSFSGLTNGNFEGGSYNDPDVDHKSGNSWHRFSLAGASKAGVPWLGSGAHSPNYVQEIYEASWTAGVYQQVTGAASGSTYTASVWVKCDADVLFWIGIDPTGGTDASSGNVQWSAQSAPGSTWTQISKQVTASSATMTVFLKAQNPIAGNRYARFDDAAISAP